MSTHIMALTYAPKIEAVKVGKCCQTIRRYNSDRPKRPGDKLIIHTWAGRPYRSKWDWRLETTISRILHLYFPDIQNGIRPTASVQGESAWHISDEMLTAIAIADGIEDPSAASLRATLKRLNGIDSLFGTEWEVIRWQPEAV
jgi:hypothetical protein